MTGRKEEDPIALAAFAEIETTSTSGVRVGLGSNLKTESGSEWAVYVGHRVKGGVLAEELRSGGRGEDRLAECNSDVGESILQENLLVLHGRVLGVVERESPGQHAYPEE